MKTLLHDMEMKEEGREEGHAEGLQEGIQLGHEEGEKKAAQLIAKLIELNRTADINKAVTDEKYRKKLMKELNI